MDFWRGLFRDSFENILLAIFLALFIRSYILTGYKVPTSTMLPTLKPGDFIFAFKPPAGFKVPLSSTKIGGSLPARGQLIVFTFSDQPQTSYVKRVIGLPGDKVQMISGELIINDKKLDYTPEGPERLNQLGLAQDLINQYNIWQEGNGVKSYSIIRKKDDAQEGFGPITVPENEVFVLGDHREASDDSRYWGTVPLQRIEGRVVLIWLSVDWQNTWAAGRLPRLRIERLMTSPN